MADLYVRDPKTGEVVVIDDSQQQLALDQGYQPVDEAGRQATQQAEISALGDQEAVTQGLLTAPEGYESQAAKEKLYSAATFGLLPGLDSAEARARGLRFQAEHPGEAFAYEVAGQLPLAVVTGAAGEAVVAGRAAAGLGRAAMAGVRAADFGVQAALGGAQTEAEQTRLAADDFSWTDAAVAGVAGEALGRGAGWAVSRAVGGTRNLIAKAEREAIADEVDDALQKGGWLNDFRVAHHAEQYQNELADLAARDLDALQVSFEEVSRQDRKRARIAKVVEDAPEAQVPIRVEAHAGLKQLRDAVAAEVGEAPSGAARSLLKQIDDRIEQLADPARTGRRLWRTLDENRQALQEFQQDLHQAYENNPGSAWLSRDGLAAVDAAERQTREALLREDAWGKAAAEAQAAYNTPFHEKYFPTEKTVKGKLMFSPYKNERGFDVFQGDPAKVRAFFARDVGDVDGARLGEQFRDYLDGVEAIARAGEADAPQAARRTMEAVRRLRKAAANAEYIAQAARRTGERAKVVELGAEVAGGVAAGAAAGPFAGAAAFGALRGARAGDWVFRAARRLGWGAGEAASMADLLARDALPAAAGRDRSVASMLDDLVESGGRSTPPPSGAPPAPGGGSGGPGPSGGPEPLDVGIFSDAPRATQADGLGASAPPPSSLPPGSGPRPTRFVGEREVNRGQVEALETQQLNEANAAQRGEKPRLEALKDELRAQMQGSLESLRATGDDAALRFADDVEENLDQIIDDEVALASERAERAAAPTERPVGAEPTLDDVDAYYAGRTPSAEARALAGKETIESLQARIDALEATDGVLPAEIDELYQRRNALMDAEDAAAKTTQAHVEQSKDLVDGAAEQGFRITQPDRVVAAMTEVFPDGKVPTPEQWKRLAPLHLLGELGETESAKITTYGSDGFIWTAEGPVIEAKPHTRWDGTEDPGGYTERAWSIARSYFRNDAGEFEVHHDHFMIAGDRQGTGVGAQVLKSMMEEYRKIGVDVVSVDSVEVGKYFWPSIGFNHPDRAVVQRAVDEYRQWVVRQGYQTGAEALAATSKIKTLPALAQAEYGKDFLLNEPGPWNFGLRMSLKDENPLYHLMRGRLDIAAGALAALGAGALEGARRDESSDPEAPAAEQAGAAAPLGGFAAAAALFKQSRGRLVRSVARALFAAAPEATAKTVARLAYSRAQMTQRQEEFQSWQANPQELVSRVAEGLRDAPPEAAAKAAQGVYAAASFLREKLPQSAKPSPVGLSGAPVSAEAAAKYARYEQAALRPREALREAAQVGYLSPELLETLQTLYPDLLAEVRVEAYQAIRETPHPTVQARTTYARLFDGDGALADPAFSATAVQMANLAFQQAAEASPPKTGAGPRPGVSQVAAAVQAPAPYRTG